MEECRDSISSSADCVRIASKAGKCYRIIDYLGFTQSTAYDSKSFTVENLSGVFYNITTCPVMALQKRMTVVLRDDAFKFLLATNELCAFVNNTVIKHKCSCEKNELLHTTFYCVETDDQKEHFFSHNPFFIVSKEYKATTCNGEGCLIDTHLEIVCKGSTYWSEAKLFEGDIQFGCECLSSIIDKVFFCNVSLKEYESYGSSARDTPDGKITRLCEKTKSEIIRRIRNKMEDGFHGLKFHIFQVPYSIDRVCDFSFKLEIGAKWEDVNDAPTAVSLE